MSDQYRGVFQHRQDMTPEQWAELVRRARVRENNLKRIKKRRKLDYSETS